MPLSEEEAIEEITNSVLRDPNAMERIRDKISKLGTPTMITFTFDCDPPKKVSIAYDDYSQALAASIECVKHKKEETPDSQEAADAMLSAAFTYSTVRNSVVKQIEDSM